MGFLRDFEDGKDEDFDENEGPALEEKYMRLYMKIGRDFVHKDDLASILIEVINAIDPDILNTVDVYSTVAAEDRAQEYREFIRSGLDGSKVYSDLIDLSDD